MPLNSVWNDTEMSGRSAGSGNSHGSVPWARKPSLSRITGVRYFGAMRAVAERAGVNSNVLSDHEAMDPLSGTSVLNGIPVVVVPV